MILYWIFSEVILEDLFFSLLYVMYWYCLLFVFFKFNIVILLLFNEKCILGLFCIGDLFLVYDIVGFGFLLV